MKEKTLIMLAAGLMSMACLFAVNPPAHAHKVMAFAYAEDGRIHVEGYFADGKKLEDSLVEVFDPGGKKILDGKTGAGGVFSFPEPGKGRIKIVLTGSMGLRAECFVEAGQDMGSSDGPAQSGQPDGSRSLSETAASDRESLRALVSQEMDKKIAPLLQEIRALKEDRPSVTEIAGGIGYVIGIMGLIMYFKARYPKGRGS